MLLTPKMLSNYKESERRFTTCRSIEPIAKEQPLIDAQHFLNVLHYRNIPFGEFVNNKERILADNDLMPINYFLRGVALAKTIARINLIDSAGRTMGYGTGFLIGKNILMTNNHVLDSLEITQSSYAEFEYELDENNKPKSSILFGFEPQKLYITDEKLDFTIVYVKQISESGGRNIADYGFVPIIETVGKVKEGDAVSIIQHPKGDRKSVALRNNTITQLDEDFIQYQTDTEPGSSGSPVFNDAWELVALHHSGVPVTDAQGRILTKKGTVATSNDDENDIAWKANEGVRISRIVAYLRQKATNTQKIFLKDIIGNTPEPVDNPNTGDANNDKNISADKYYKGIDLAGNNLFEAFSNLLNSTHKNKLSYNPSKNLYPSVDVYPDGKLRSVYSGKTFTLQELLVLDEQIDVQRKARFIEVATREATMSTSMLKSVLEDIEDTLPYNCEHVVPQSWFGKKEPMRGDLHHLFTCEVKCNSFRSNTPYFDFPDFKPSQTPITGEVVKDNCGKSENNGFEPQYNQGAVARATLYFLLRYPKSIGAKYDKNRLKMLISWHKKFPVTEYEKSRNNKIQAAQGNRNPLIDFPQLVDKIDFIKGL